MYHLTVSFPIPLLGQILSTQLYESHLKLGGPKKGMLFIWSFIHPIPENSNNIFLPSSCPGKGLVAILFDGALTLELIP